MVELSGDDSLAALVGELQEGMEVSRPSKARWRLSFSLSGEEESVRRLWGAMAMLGFAVYI